MQRRLKQILWVQEGVSHFSALLSRPPSDTEKNAFKIKENFESNLWCGMAGVGGSAEEREKSQAVQIPCVYLNNMFKKLIYNLLLSPNHTSFDTLFWTPKDVNYWSADKGVFSFKRVTEKPTADCNSVYVHLGCLATKRKCFLKNKQGIRMNQWKSRKKNCKHHTEKQN